MIATLFTVFYVDDAYVNTKDSEFLQHALDHLVETFQHVGVETNTQETVAMTCTPGKIWAQLPKGSYENEGREPHSQRVGGTESKV